MRLLSQPVPGRAWQTGRAAWCRCWPAGRARSASAPRAARGAARAGRLARTAAGATVARGKSTSSNAWQISRRT
eukprot:9998396-Alexandrium_andersonii.AAC.1